MKGKELYIGDTELTVPVAGIGHIHTKTKEKPRLTDGVRHPVKTRKATEKELADRMEVHND